LIKVAAGSTPVEHLFKMWDSLLAYAQSFERFEPFKLYMTLETDIIYLTDHYGPKSMYKEYDNLYRAINPFRPQEDYRHIHPVERALGIACVAVWRQNPISFKAQCIKVLQHLRKQHRRILEIRQYLVLFIRSQQTEGGIFDANRRKKSCEKGNIPSSCGHPDLYVFAFQLLKDYENSFKRPLVFSIRMAFAKEKVKHQTIYRDLPREKIMMELENLIANRKFNFFPSISSEPSKKMEIQFESIYHGREKLFNADIGSVWQIKGVIDQNQYDVEKVEWDRNTYSQRITSQCRLCVSSY
jgi:hypothetical protein